MSTAKTKYLSETTLTKDKGVIKKIIHQGISDGEDCMPYPGQSVVIWYEARLENGVVVDKSMTHSKDGTDSFKLVVGMGEVIEGWDMGL